MNDYKKHTSAKKLEDIKEDVDNAYKYFRKNYTRFNEFTFFVCASTLDADKRTKLKAMNRPEIEFNCLETFINKQASAFINQEPSPYVTISESVPFFTMGQQEQQQLEQTRKVVESYFRERLSRFKTNGMAYNTLKEMMTGGFSVWYVRTDYIKGSFMQDIIFEKEVFPTMCYFDPQAKESHKGDGDFCGRVILKKKEEAEMEFGKEAFKNMTWSNSFRGFKWSYSDLNEEFVVICEHFEKKKKRIKLLQLSDGQVMESKKYKAFLEMWIETGQIAQPPIPIDERYETQETICRYWVCESSILMYEETDYEMLPLIFFDNDSVYLCESGDAKRTQFTRPAIYHAKGPQEAKNIAGQVNTYEVMNTMAHKVAMNVEAIDKNYLDTLTNFQIGGALVWKMDNEERPEQPNPPPQIIARPQVPQIITQTFFEADKMIQASLGSYDMQTNLQSKELSGLAYQEIALQTAGTFSPSLKGYIDGVNRALVVGNTLLPKYYKTPRSIPIIDEEGKKTYQLININQLGSVWMDYDPKSFNINVQEGANCEVQKRISLETLERFSKSNPLFNQFIGEYCIPNIIDNMDLRTKQQIMLNAEKFTQQQQQMKQMAMQNKPKDPVAVQEKIEMAKLQQKSQETQINSYISGAELALKDKELNLQEAELVMKAQGDAMKTVVAANKVDAEMARTEIMRADELMKFNRQLILDHHDVNMSKQENDRENRRHEKEMREPIHKPNNSVRNK